MLFLADQWEKKHMVVCRDVPQVGANQPTVGCGVSLLKLGPGLPASDYSWVQSLVWDSQSSSLRQITAGRD